MLVALALLLAPLRAHAEDAGALLERAHQLVTVELRYADSIELLQRVLADPELQRTERVEAYRLLGIAYAARGATGSATAAFAELLALEPEYVLDPLLSPKIHRCFESARASRPPPPEPPAPLPVAAEAAPAAAPVITPRAEESPGLTSRWWFWALVVGVAAAGAGTAIVLSSGETAGPAGTLDPIVLGR